MKNTIKILFIAPFAQMQSLAQDIGATYPDVDLTVLVGNQDIGRQLARERYSNSYDCIISRGNTADMIRQAVSIPVVDIKLNLYDVLSSVTDLPEPPRVAAAVGFRNVLSGLEVLEQFLPFLLEVHPIDHPDQAQAIFDDLQARGIRVIICDTIVRELAAARGFHACLLQSGETSLRYAFERARHLCHSNSAILEENQLLRRLLIANSESETVVFSEDGRLYYSALQEEDAPLLPHLQERLPDFETQNRFRMVKQLGSFHYRISARKLTTGTAVYFAFFLTRRPLSVHIRHKCVSYHTESQVGDTLRDSIYFTAIRHYCTEDLRRAVSYRTPVVIYGDVGIGKNHLARMIYLDSPWRKNPLIIIDCALMTPQAWNFLIHKSDSPFSDIDNTLYIKNIDALDEPQLKQLLSMLQDSELLLRNQLILSCSSLRALSSTSGLPVLKVADQLEAITIFMPSLREDPAALDHAITLILNDCIQRHQTRSGNLTPQARALLLQFRWPQNYVQLIRVVHKVSALAGTGSIEEFHVEEALKTEMSFVHGETTLSGNATLDLSKPLQELNRDIARIVLDQFDGNNTAAAKSLGISRTTLWRMVRTEDDPQEKG